MYHDGSRRGRTGGGIIVLRHLAWTIGQRGGVPPPLVAVNGWHGDPLGATFPVDLRFVLFASCWTRIGGGCGDLDSLRGGEQRTGQINEHKTCGVLCY